MGSCATKTTVTDSTSSRKTRVQRGLQHVTARRDSGPLPWFPEKETKSRSIKRPRILGPRVSLHRKRNGFTEQQNRFQFNFPVSALHDADKQLEDKTVAVTENANIVYGETRVAGVSKLLGSDYLNAKDAKVVADLGMGSGKWLIQAFIEYSNLERVVGWELTPTRFKLAKTNLKNFAALGRASFDVEEKGTTISAIEKPTDRRQTRCVEFNKGNLFECLDIGIADIVYLQTAFYNSDFPRLCQFLSHMKSGARLCSYKNIETIYASFDGVFPFKQHPRYGDTFAASWFGGEAHMNLYIRK